MVWMVCAIAGVDVSGFGICKGCQAYARLAYSFFHASFFHAAINCWCLLCIVFTFRVPLWQLVAAYAIACSYPFGGIPTVGLSAVDFALLAMVSWKVARKLFYHSWMLSFIVAGYVFPAILQWVGMDVARPNNTLHIYSYVVGLIVGFMDSTANGYRFFHHS